MAGTALSSHRISASQGVRCARAAPRQARARGLVARAAAAADPGVEGSVRCYTTADGHLVCERLEPGNYRVEAADPQTHTEDPALPAPRCDPANPKECITYCYVMDDGSMVCEGLPSGNYQITKAGDEDLPKLVEHAQKLRDGVTMSTSPVAAAAEKPAEEAKGLLGKITGMFRST